MIQELIKSLRGTGALPYLFIGSGFSQRYIHAETWKNLLIYLTNLMDNGKNYSQYQRIAMDYGAENSNLLAEVASIISKDFNTIWYEKDIFESSREKCKDLIDRGIVFSPFKYEIAKHLCELVDSFDLNGNPEIDSLRKVNSYSLSGIITTNYDQFLEKYIFPSFDVKIGQDGILFSDSLEIENIYKIHGCVSDFDTMVIDSKDYKTINQKQAYLAAKLLTIFCENPIIFIGYSISDPDIISLLQAIKQGLNDQKRLELADRLFFVEWDNSLDDVTYFVEYHTINDIQLTKIRLNNYSILYDSISEIRASYNPKLYKKIKKSIYDVVKSNDATKSIFYIPDNITDSQLDNIDVIVGFNIIRPSDKLPQRGVIGITSESLYADLMYDNLNLENYSAEDLLSVIYYAGYPANYSVPLFKYKDKFEHLLFQDRYLKLKSVIENRRTEFEKKFSSTNNDTYEEIMGRSITFGSKCRQIANTNYSNLDIFVLERFIKDNFSEAINNQSRSEFKKVMKIYDYLKYGRK